MFGHVEDGKPEEEWFLHLAYRCIQFDTDQILGIHGSPSDHILSVLLNDCLSFIPSSGKLHFYLFQSNLHEFVIYRICQQFIEVLFHSGFGLSSFLTQHIHILEYEWSLLESNDMMNVSDSISLLNIQLKE